MVNSNVMVEIVGEAGVGKTHMSCSFPAPYVIDCGTRGESRYVVEKCIGLKGGYTLVRDWKGVLAGVKEAMELKKETVVFDLSEQLVKMAGKEWCRVNGKKAIFPVTNYHYVYEMVDELFGEVIGAGMNLVLVSGLKDNWKNGDKTGRREHAGYNKLPYICDIRVLLEVVEKDGRMIRRGKVVKNRFMDVCGDDYVKELNSCDYAGVLELKKK